MKKIGRFTLALVISIATFVSGCGGSSGAKPADAGRPGVSSNEAAGGSKGGENTLNILTWKDYGPDYGFQDYDFIPEFEQKYGCKIVLQYIASQDDQLTKLKTAKEGEVDICLPNCTILEDAITAGLLKELDTSKITSFQDLFERFQTQEECIKDGKYYAMPFVWGSTAIAYNTEEFTSPPDSVKMLYDPIYAGKISMRDSYDDMIMTTAIYLGQDPNHPSDLDAIKATLLEQKPLNRTYWKTGDDFSKLFANKQISVGLMWSGQTASMQIEGEPIAYVVPKEGAIGWVDNWAIASSCQNEELAYQFINEMLSQEFQFRYSSQGGPAPTNEKAAAALAPDYVKAAAMDEDSLNRLHFKIGRSNEEKTQWNELWTEVKATTT